MPRNPLDRIGNHGSRIHILTLPELLEALSRYMERANARYDLKFRGRRTKPTVIVNALLTWFLEGISEQERDRLYLRYSELFDKRRDKIPGAADYPTGPRPHPLEPPLPEADVTLPPARKRPEQRNQRRRSG